MKKIRIVFEHDRRMISVLLWVTIVASTFAQDLFRTSSAIKTNQVFSTAFIQKIQRHSPHEESVFYKNRMICGQLIPEILPSVLDTNGNWGNETDKLQMSVRFRSSEYLNGETVNALVLFRNLSSSNRLSWRKKRDEKYDYEYLLMFGTNKSVWTATENTGQTLTTEADVAQPRLIRGHSQIAFTVSLNEFFDLSQIGQYSLQVSRREPVSGRGFTNIVSGWAFFSVVKELSQSQSERLRQLHQDQTEIATRAEKLSKIDGTIRQRE